MAGRLVILVDSDVLIAHLRGIESAHARPGRQAHAGPLTVSVVSIAATAELRGLRLATLNVRHFSMFADLRTSFAIS